MLYRVLATDFDGTMAQDGRADPAVIAALTRLKTAGKRLVLVTGREIPSIKDALPAIELFDLVVAENGAVLYFPKQREERPLAPAPDAAFIAALKQKGVAPLSVGHSVVATWTPNEHVVLRTIRDLGLDCQVIFNKGAVMCLPAGVNKASGLAAAMEEMKLSPLNAVGIGDAENDLAFLAVCGCSVAVANALEAVKRAADITTVSDHGRGVTELIDHWMSNPSSTFGAVRRHDLYLGDSPDRTKAMLNPDQGAVLIAGSSGAGKSRLTTMLIERLVEGHYQVAIVDPEGDYGELENFTHLGDAKRTPAPEEVRDALNSPHVNLVVNLLGTDLAQRPDYFQALFGLMGGLYSNTGRPHWLILDEAHHLYPNIDERSARPADSPYTILVAAEPESLSRSALDAIGTVIAVGARANDVIAAYCRLAQVEPPSASQEPGDDQVLLWTRGHSAVVVSVGKSKQAHHRHTRKYAQGRLGEDVSFYFRGPAAALNLRAYNLSSFLELAQGVDDATWLYHLKCGDYTRWFRNIIKDEDLAAEAQSSESLDDANQSRRAVAEAIKKRYVVAAAAP
jgi:hypothetical protein